LDYGSLAYQLVKVGHIVAVVAWRAGMLYLPRLFVYHADAAPGSDKSETFKVMERRLLKAILNPAMAATWVFGLALAWGGGFLAAPWLHAKLGLVVVLSGLHGYLAGLTRAFATDRNSHPARFYRILNEGPTVLLILIVFLVVLKPFSGPAPSDAEEWQRSLQAARRACICRPSFHCRRAFQSTGLRSSQGQRPVRAPSARRPRPARKTCPCPAFDSAPPFRSARSGSNQSPQQGLPCGK